jgi:hypothetical protein
VNKHISHDNCRPYTWRRVIKYIRSFVLCWRAECSRPPRPTLTALPERVPGASPTTCRPPDGTAARSVDVYVRVSRDVGVKLLFFFFVVSVHQLSFVQF